VNEFYDVNKVPDGDRLPLEKNVLITIPDKDFDLEPALQWLGLTKWEVAVTWPKDSVDMLAEICAAKPKLVIQAGKRFFRKFPVLASSIREKALDATADKFVCLHHHDEYSLRDGLGTVEQLIKVLKARRQSYCSVTNHGSVGGWIRQYNACKKAGVKAIFGFEAYVSNYRGDDPELKKAHRSANHLVLLAATEEGFYNIIQIHNDGQLNGFYYTPRIEHNTVRKWGKGVIGSSSCMAGEIPRLLVEGKRDEAEAVYRLYAEALDEFYIEIQIIEHEDQRKANRLLVEFAKEVGAPLLITCDSHYLEPEHSETHDLLMCMRQGKTIFDRDNEDKDVWNFDVKNLYYRDAEAMRSMFVNGYTDANGDHPPFRDDVFTDEVFEEALANTVKVARTAQNIKLDSSIKLPKLYDDAKGTLRAKVNEGFRRRGLFKHPKKNEYLARVKFEFGVIVKLGWPDYFLVMDWIIEEAKIAANDLGINPEWAVGYGRGSAAGSLVSYCLGLTDIDPIEYGLLFERFLDEGRPDPPDIDTDFDPRVRDRVKQRIVEMFGEDKVCSIGTYSSYKTSSVILDVARVLGESVPEANVVTKKLDPLREFEDDEGTSHKVDMMGFDELCEHYPELKKYLAEHEDVRHHSEILRNQVKNMGKHAGGVIISDIPLNGRIPVLWNKPSDDDRQVISAWAEGTTKSELSSVGLVKFDLLGLKNLPIISDCIALVKETRGIDLPRAEVPINDKESIKFGSKDDLVGIFQLENPATRPVVNAVVMESLDDVSAVTSLIRPGPRDNEMDMIYARRKHGEPYDMPKFMKDALAETYGVMTYQEQCMRMSQVLAGFTGPESNKLRKAIGKKIDVLMAEMKVKFIKGAQKRVDAGDITAEEVVKVWELMETFAGYGFNKSHAVAYSAISTVELWLKYHYLPEYLTALINNTKLGQKKYGYDAFGHYINYARKKGIDVLGPDVSESKNKFTINGDKIRFSLSHIKNVASQAPVIESFQPIISIEDFHERVKVESVGKTGKTTAKRPNKKVVESLVAAGAFDQFGTRNEVMTEYYRCRKGKKEEPPQHTDDEWVELEKEVLGLCLSKPPLYKDYEDLIRKSKWKLVSEADEKKKVKVFGMIESIKPHTSKKGSSMYMVHMTDGLDVLNFWVFHGAQQFFRDHFKVGTIAAVPLDKFDDGGMRFFDDRAEAEIVKD